MTTTDPVDPGAPRIVVGVDGSPSSVGALEWAVHYAFLTSYGVDALISWEWPTSYGTPLFLPTGYDPQSDATGVIDRVVAPERQRRPSVSIRTRVVEGHPTMALVDASVGAELLVVGSRGYGEFGGILLGSVGQHCVAHAHCPVLVYRDDRE